MASETRAEKKEIERLCDGGKNFVALYVGFTDQVPEFVEAVGGRVEILNSCPIQVVVFSVDRLVQYGQERVTVGAKQYAENEALQDRIIATVREEILFEVVGKLGL